MTEVQIPHLQSHRWNMMKPAVKSLMFGAWELDQDPFFCTKKKGMQPLLPWLQHRSLEMWDTSVGGFCWQLGYADSMCNLK